MRRIADGGCTEGSDSLSPLLRIHGRDGSGRHCNSVPEDHRGNIHQMTQQNAGNAEMTEKGQRFRIGVDHPVEAAFPDISVLGQNFVKGFRHPVIRISDSCR